MVVTPPYVTLCNGATLNRGQKPQFWLVSSRSGWVPLWQTGATVFLSEAINFNGYWFRHEPMGVEPTLTITSKISDAHNPARGLFQKLSCRNDGNSASHSGIIKLRKLEKIMTRIFNLRRKVFRMKNYQKALVCCAVLSVMGLVGCGNSNLPCHSYWSCNSQRVSGTARIRNYFSSRLVKESNVVATQMMKGNMSCSFTPNEKRLFTWYECCDYY